MKKESERFMKIASIISSPVLNTLEDIKSDIKTYRDVAGQLGYSRPRELSKYENIILTTKLLLEDSNAREDIPSDAKVKIQDLISKIKEEVGD